MSHAFATPLGQTTPTRQGDKPAAKGSWQKQDRQSKLSQEIDIEKELSEAFKHTRESQARQADKATVADELKVKKANDEKQAFRQKRHDKIEQLVRQREQEQKERRKAGNEKPDEFMGFPLAGPDDDISELLSRDLLQRHSGEKGYHFSAFSKTSGPEEPTYDDEPTRSIINQMWE